MIYTIDDVRKEIHRYFTDEVDGDNKDIIENTIGLAERIFKNENILEACKEIKDSIISLSIDGKVVFKDKKFLPDWIKYLVYVVIYQYLSSKRKPKYTQSELLREMGLYADIFGKKNWNMYSPDMKKEQAKFDTIDLPFNHAEIETNKIYRAMIHHMICYSKVLTDNFVDVFGKMGLISALCANGYGSAQTWLDDRDYKLLSIFKHALKKKDKVLKAFEEIRYEIKHEQNSIKLWKSEGDSDEQSKRVFLNRQQTIALYMGLFASLELKINNISMQELNKVIELNVPLVFEQLFNLNEKTIREIIDSCKKIENDEQFMKIGKKDLTENEKKQNKDNKKKKKDVKIKKAEEIVISYREKCGANIKYCPDIYKYVVYFIIYQYFSTEYWMDSNLVIGKDDKGNDIITSELKEKLSANRINNFLDDEKGQKYEEGLVTLANAYGKKRFAIENVAIDTAINEMKVLIDNVYSMEDDTDLLYLDVPKYQREQKRYEFETEWYEILFAFLSVHKGDWILTWKNYIEISKGKQNIYSGLYSEDKITSFQDLEMNADTDESNEEILDVKFEDDMLTRYTQLLEISKERQLYVFQYRDDDRNHPNSIIFITTIDFYLLEKKAFEEKYKIRFTTYERKGRGVRLEKMKYEKFYSNMLRWLGYGKKKNNSSEESENGDDSK